MSQHAKAPAESKANAEREVIDRCFKTLKEYHETGNFDKEAFTATIQELKQKAVDCPEDIELHKPYIDNVHLNCPECGKKMTRFKEVIDVCWNEVNKKDIYSYSGVVSELRDLFYQIEQLDDIPENQGLCWIKTYPEEYIDDELGVYLSIITKE